MIDSLPTVTSHKQAAKEANKAKVNKSKILFWLQSCQLHAHTSLVCCTHPSIQTGCPKNGNGKGEQI